MKKNRNAAHENADTLMNKKKYIYAAYFYLLSDDIRSALDMVYEKMRDINLTVCMLKLVDSKYGNDSWKKYYSLEKIYKDLFINFGTVFRDPNLVTFGYLGQGKYDLALEYILTYDNEYSFDNNKEIFQDIDDYVSNLNILRKSFALNVFDYRMILFRKSNIAAIFRSLPRLICSSSVEDVISSDYVPSTAKKHHPSTSIRKTVLFTALDVASGEISSPL